MIKLIFAGELITGFDHPTVIENLSRLLKQSPEVIERRLFNGSEVTLKRVASEAESRKWLQAFARAGALLVAQEEAATEAPPVVLEQTPSSDQKPSVNKQPSTPKEPSASAPEKNQLNPAVTRYEEPSALAVTRRLPAVRERGRAYRWLGLMALALVAVIILALWLTRPLWQSATLDERQQNLAAALATQDTYLLGHADLMRARDLAELVGIESDLEALIDADSDWASLSAAGLDPRTDLAHLWFAGFNSGEGAELVLVATGIKSPEKAQAWFAERYEVLDSKTGVLFTRTLDDCQKSTPLLAEFYNDVLVVGTPARVTSVLTRIKSGASAEIDLAEWQRISADQLGSLAVFAPADMGRGLAGMPGLMMRGVAASAAPARGVYLGFDPVLTPPGLEASVLVTSDDQAFINTSYQVFSERVEEWRTQADKNWPELEPLYDRISVSKRDEGVYAAVRFDKHLRRDINNWFSSIFSGIFSSAGGAAASDEERIDDNPPVFANLTGVALPSYSDYRQIPDFFFTPAIEAGPFALGITELTTRDDSGLDIVLAAQAYNLSNLPSRGAAAHLIVDDLIGTDGQSLLRTPECGEDTHRAPADIGNVMASSTYIDGEEIDYVRVSGNKTLSLPPGIALADIAAIKGRIVYQQAMSLTRVPLAAPLAGQVVEQNGLRVRFMGADETALQYQYSGATEKLLHVFAKNSAGQPLDSGSAMWGGALMGSGKTASVSYYGTVKSVELVIASELREHEFAFELTDLHPALKEGDLTQATAAMDAALWPQLLEAPAPAVTYSWQKPVSEQAVGPVQLAVNEVNFDESFGFSFNADAYLSNQYPLLGVLGAGELVLTAMENSAGESIAMSQRSFFPFEYDGGYWMNGVYQPDDERPWVKGSVQFRDRELKGADIVRLQGELGLSLPTRTHSETMPFALGASWSDGELSVTFNSWKGSSIGFSWQGDLGKLVTVKAYADDELVSQPAKVQQMFGEASIQLELTRRPTRLELEVIDTREQQRFPFTLDLATENEN